MKHLLKLIPPNKNNRLCPWCEGNKLEVVEDTFDYSIFIRCANCWACGPTCDTPDGAIEKWNKGE